MIIVDEKTSLPFLASPYGLTIGSFDGVHRGHMKLIERLRALCTPSGTIAVFTFRNHPSEFLSPETAVSLICPLSQKLRLLEKAGVDLVFLNDFTSSVANMPYHNFITALHERFPFSYLILGAGSAFGKGRLGTDAKILGLAKTISFQVEYIPKMYVDDKEVSSRKIRSLIERGEIEKASLFLGRPYSLLLPFPSQPNNKGYILHVPDLCLLPSNKYQSLLLLDGKQIESFIEVRKEEQKILVPINDPSLSEKEIEIVFKRRCCINR